MGKMIKMKLEGEAALQLEITRLAKKAGMMGNAFAYY